MSHKIKVVLFEDNDPLRKSMSDLVNSNDALVCVGAFENCQNLVNDIKATKPDIVMMDIAMPGINGIEAVGILSAKYPAIKIIMQTIYEDNEKIFQSILAGASGYILKNTPPLRILDFIKETYDGGASMSPSVASKVLKMVSYSSQSPGNTFNLSDREKDILSCLVKGMSYKLVADSCFISIDTVRNHIRHIYEKLHVNSKGEAIAMALKNGLI